MGNKSELEKDIFDLAMAVGYELLKNGAEIYRVKDTIKRITKSYGVETEELYVLTNGIFMSKNGFSGIRDLPVGEPNLEKITELNQLSREIEGGKYTVMEADRRLKEIIRKKNKKHIGKILAAGIGSGCFCYIMGGRGTENIAAYIVGTLLYLYSVFMEKTKLSNITICVLGGGVTAFFCLMLSRLMGGQLYRIISGAILPMIPGVAFVTGIKDMGAGDYLAGTIRLLDAIIVFLGLSIGVGGILWILL